LILVKNETLTLPHLVTGLDAEWIGKVAHVTKANIALWPLPAPFDEDDRFDATRDAAPLSAWALPLNQTAILSLSPIIQEAIFRSELMLLDAAFDEETLSRVAVTPRQRLETGAYVARGFQDLPELPQLVQQCGWVVIPIGPERSRSLFLTSPTHAGWIAQLQEWCDRKGRTCGQFRLDQGAPRLIDHAAPDEYRRAAIAHRIDTFLSEVEVYFGGVDESVLGTIEQRIQHRQKLQQDIARSKTGAPAA
jgi:hypothetical protein